MLNRQDFLSCVSNKAAVDKLGKKRMDALVKRFNGLHDSYVADGYNTVDAQQLAAARVVSDTIYANNERARRALKSLQVNADQHAAVAQGVKRAKRFKSAKKKGVAVARAAIARIENDPRYAGTSYDLDRETTRGLLFSVMGDVLEKVQKGAFGVQRGKGHLRNIVREAFGQRTGDFDAEAIAKAWSKTENLSVDLFRKAGGSMGRLNNYFPQADNSVAKMVKRDKRYRQLAHKTWDWDRMRWPDGSRIDPADRDDVITFVFNTKVTNGANKIDSTSLRGFGSSVGNQLDNHRFVHYKNGDAWLEMNDEFGDGGIFDRIVHHIEDMSHKTAIIQNFGTNPQMGADGLRSIVRKQAAQFGGEAVAAADSTLKNTFNPMFEIASRQNPMDPHSTTGALVTGVGNTLTSAYLGGAALLAIPGDFVTTVTTRMANKMPMAGGTKAYVDAFAADRQALSNIAAQTGFVMEHVVSALYGAQRYTGVATIGPAVTRRLSDTVMRASFMTPHTTAARFAAQSEFMGLLHRNRSMSFDSLPYKAVMERYGITKDDWNFMRTGVKSWSPKPGAEFMRPLDVLNSGRRDALDLYQKFQGMIFRESQHMVPEATIEAMASLRGSTRPDTLRGAILYSFAMFKNFPTTFILTYSRLAATQAGAGGKLKYIAALGLGMTVAGALGLQMREMAKGRDPRDMSSPSFWGKALLAGGGLGIWGDFIFAGVNEHSRGPAELIGGPLASFASDTMQLALGDTFRHIAVLEGLRDKGFEKPFASRLLEYAQRQTPGGTVWQIRAALERNVFDQIEALVDPRAESAWRRREAARVRQGGSESFWQFGDALPSRAPDFRGVTGQ